MSQDRVWKQVSPHVAERRLIGVEKMLNYAEYYQNGNFQLSIAMVFESNIPVDTLRKRFGLAVWIVRGFLPELGLWAAKESPLDLDHATFEAIQSVEQAQKWIEDTAICAKDGTTSQEVVDVISNSVLQPIGKQFRVYLVSNPRDGKKSVVLHASHVLNGHRMLFQGCAILQALVDARLADLLETIPDPREALKTVFVPEDLSHILNKLPISLNTAYNEKFSPTSNELEVGMGKLGERLTNCAQSTIGIPRLQTPLKSPEYSLGTLEGQPMTMLNLRRRFGAAEHRMLHQAFKKRGSSLPSFVYACIVNSIDRRYKTDTSEDGETPGANLAYSAHASRWLPQETFVSRSPVNMAITLGSAYITPEELRSARRGRDLNEDELFALAKTIRTKQEQYLDSPHIISSMDKVSDDVSAMMSETAIKHREAGTDLYVALSENSPAVCCPTLTSQGDIPIKRFFTSDGASFDPKPSNYEAEYNYLIEGILGGRTTDASVCFAMWSFAGILTLQAHFDSRFFDAKLIDTILDDVIHQLRKSAYGFADESAQAKL
ncbi:probable Acyltransferase invovled in MEL production [Melanopsichium pennsylvanicum]|uniref:Acyltransferase invovled in MEL production n=2 Tax=Melanopsichium pennsylvanicum TaxID=63383 RepID=A0A077QV35_9BASI|nr:conserved hypothetical protein [Melanopsichium pennsylvanicum 4]SNX87155.1 probable Acyltransferase invovled in MEL production [Melanopsichium pennsylvanicum]